MKNLLLVVLMLCFSLSLYAQDESGEVEVDHSYKPLTAKLNEDGSKYIRFIMWHQIWATSNNLAIPDLRNDVTFSMRRSRFLAYAQISPKFLILTHFGINNFNPGNMTALGNDGNSPQLFLHDAWGEFKLHDYVYVGAGLHYWKGLTRLANQSTLNFMTLDQARPFTQWHSLGITDQFARHLGFYFKGQIDKFDYRIAINNPGRNGLGMGRDFGGLSDSLTYNGFSVPENDGDLAGNIIYEGYFRYNFWDTESVKLPYIVGSYLGAKDVLAVGAGFFFHPNGMYNHRESEHENVTHLAADVFLEKKMGDGDCFHAYASYINFNYGENYMSRWAGTGSNIYGQVGYYYKAFNIMPYVAYQSGFYDAFNSNNPTPGFDAGNPGSLNVGLNYYINGHFAKATLEYHSIFNNPLEGGVDADGNPNGNQQIRLQLHFFL